MESNTISNQLYNQIVQITIKEFLILYRSKVLGCNCSFVSLKPRTQKLNFQTLKLSRSPLKETFQYNEYVAVIKNLF